MRWTSVRHHLALVLRAWRAILIFIDHVYCYTIAACGPTECTWNPPLAPWRTLFGAMFWPCLDDAGYSSPRGWWRISCCFCNWIWWPRECSKMLKFPRGERVSEQAFDHEQKALHGAGEAFSCYFVPLWSPVMLKMVLWIPLINSCLRWQALFVRIGPHARARREFWQKAWFLGFRNAPPRSSEKQILIKSQNEFAQFWHSRSSVTAILKTWWRKSGKRVPNSEQQSSKKNLREPRTR